MSECFLVYLDKGSQTYILYQNESLLIESENHEKGIFTLLSSFVLHNLDYPSLKKIFFCFNCDVESIAIKSHKNDSNSPHLFPTEYDRNLHVTYNKEVNETNHFAKVRRVFREKGVIIPVSIIEVDVNPVIRLDEKRLFTIEVEFYSYSHNIEEKKDYFLHQHALYHPDIITKRCKDMINTTSIKIGKLSNKYLTDKHWQEAVINIGRMFTYFEKHSPLFSLFRLPIVNYRFDIIPIINIEDIEISKIIQSDFYYISNTDYITENINRYKKDEHYPVQSFRVNNFYNLPPYEKQIRIKFFKKVSFLKKHWYNLLSLAVAIIAIAVGILVAIFF